MLLSMQRARAGLQQPLLAVLIKPVIGDATQPAKGGRQKVEQNVDTELACPELARLSGHPVDVDMTGNSADEKVLSDDDKVESNVSKPAAEASNSDPDILTFRIRWRLSGKTEAIHMLKCATVYDMKYILERQLDDTAEQKTRVRLFLGSQGPDEYPFQVGIPFCCTLLQPTFSSFR